MNPLRTESYFEGVRDARNGKALADGLTSREGIRAADYVHGWHDGFDLRESDAAFAAALAKDHPLYGAVKDSRRTERRSL